MTNKSNRLLWWLGLLVLVSGFAYILASLAFYSLGGLEHEGKGFQLLGAMRMPTFADLRWVTANSECGVDLDAFYQAKVGGCDAFGRREIGYPPMSIWLLRLFHFQAGWTNLLALICGLGFLAISGFLLININKNSGVSMLISGLLLWGYPVQLGLERMNIDILVYIFVIFNCYLLSITIMPWRALTSLPLITATVGMKIYPIFGYIGLLFMTKPIARIDLARARLGKLDAAIILAGCTIGLITATPILIGNHASVSAGYGAIGSHGLKAFGFINQKLIDLYGLEPARLMIKAIFLLKLLSLAIGFATTFYLQITKEVKQFIDNLSSPTKRDFAGYSLTAMTCMWLGCYVTTISYDYRLIFLLPLISILAQLSASRMNHWPASTYWAATVTAMAIIPGILTSAYMAINSSSAYLLLGHEVMVEFIMLPIVAGSTTALLLQFLGMSSFLKHLLPTLTPAPRDPHR